MTPTTRLSNAQLDRFEIALDRLCSISRRPGYASNDLRFPNLIPRRMAVEEFLTEIAPLLAPALNAHENNLCKTQNSS